MKGRLRGRMGGSMTAYKDRSKEELLQEKSQLEAQYKDCLLYTSDAADE